MNGYGIDPGDARIASLQATCARLEQRIDDQEVTIERLEQRARELEQQLNDTDVNQARLLVDVNERLANLDGLISGQQVTIDQLWKQLDTAHGSIHAIGELARTVDHIVADVHRRVDGLQRVIKAAP